MKLSKELLLGIDLGTTGTKASLYDINGKLIFQAYEESILSYPEAGWVEQRLEDIYASAINCIREIINNNREKSKFITAVAFSSQMSGIGMIDQDWNPVAHYDSWLDTRCEESFAEMNEIGDLITKYSGCPPTYAHLAKIIWWKNNHPDIFKKTYKFIVPSAFVAGKMADLKADEAYIDYTFLHFTGLTDNNRKKWSEEILSYFQIPLEKMPKIVSPTEIIGEISQQAAIKTGLTEGTPIVAGAGDTAMASLGAGVVSPGNIFDSAGTASILSLCLKEFMPDVENQVVLASHGAVPNTYNALSFINGGGLNLRWFRDEFAEYEQEKAKILNKETFHLLDDAIKNVDPGSNKSIFIPHTQGRVLPPDSMVRGLWTGFTWGHNKIHMYRSILESVAFEYAYYLQIVEKLHPTIKFNSVRVVGGGAKSKIWNQIKSDVLNIPYSTIDRSEVGTWGTAMIAGKGIGIYEDLQEVAERTTVIKETIYPREDYHQFYLSYIDVYREILEGYQKLFKNIKNLPTWKN